MISDLLLNNPDAHLMQIKSLAMKLRMALFVYTKAAENAFITHSLPTSSKDACQKSYKELVLAGYHVTEAMMHLRSSAVDFYDLKTS